MRSPPLDQAPFARNRTSLGRALGLAAAGLGLLAGCAGNPAPQSSTAAVARPAQTEIPSQNETVRETKPAQQARTTPAAPAAPPPRQDPRRLIGLSPESVNTLLGPPAFVRRDPPAEFWRYRGAGCVVEIYFYDRNGAHTLDHIEARAAGTGRVDAAECLGALIAAHRKS